jgi:hypothetical protein
MSPRVPTFDKPSKIQFSAPTRCAAIQRSR